MKHKYKKWATLIASLSVNHAWKMLGLILVLTIIAMGLAEHLEMKMNFTDMLSDSNPTVIAYEDIQDRWGDPSIVVVLEGDRDHIVQMAEILDKRIRQLDGLYNVQSQLPTSFIMDHGLILQKEKDFNRFLRTYNNPNLVGTLQGFNDDYEREYSDSEDNMRRDEVQIANSLLGLTRTLEIISRNLDGDKEASISEATTTMLTGEPWMLSLDRRMLLMSITTQSNIMDDVEEVLLIVDEVELILDDLESEFSDVDANLSGMGRIGKDEMESIGLYTQILSLIALILIYVILARNFRGWVLPLIALTPLLVGIIWDMGLMQLLFGSLNIMSVMMMLVLLGLGIDFTIHLLSRYSEARSNGMEVQESIEDTLSNTGTGVLTGGLTTAAAFFALMIGDTHGVFEFGVAAGAGVILTLIAVFLTLPVLLVLRERRAAKRGKILTHPVAAQQGWKTVGNLAVFSWKNSNLVLISFLIIAVLSFFAAKNTGFEYNFLKLEPDGLKSIELQREIPDRFGLSEQTGWSVVHSIEEARILKEKLKDLPSIADVQSISDYIPPNDRYTTYADRISAYERNILGTRLSIASRQELAVEIDRLWDNLDLMSNLAFQSGIDRVVKVIDNVTGYNSETDETDDSALLPTITKQLSSNLTPGILEAMSSEWFTSMQVNLLRMANTSELSIQDIPESVRKSLIPRDGSGDFLIHVMPREALWEKDALDHFIGQTEEIDPNIVNMAKLFIVMTTDTLRDGRIGAYLALGIIAVLLLVHFKGLGGLLAMVPLLGSALAMLGIMYIFGMKYNYINLIAVPIILGIGIDDGVHALHRFKEAKGKLVERVFDAYRYVGRSIFLTSITTMIGFGSIGFYTMKGMSSFGIVLFIGVGFCFLMTILILPAVLRLFTKKEKS